LEHPKHTYAYDKCQPPSYEAVKCPLWPFRAGKHPWLAPRGKKPSDTHGFYDGEAIQDGKSLARWKTLPGGAGRTPMPGGGQ
jgi:hypothetical protein